MIKNTLTIIGLIAALSALSVNAQTFNGQPITSQTVTNKYNEVNAKASSLTNSATVSLDKSDSDKGMPMELTLGGAGVTNPKTGANSVDLNVSLSVQPFSKPIWFGISQELGWSPSLNGATDLDAAWAFPIVKDKLYLNAGWSGGATYDRESIGWRTGPELSLEYYTTGNAFIIAGANYDLFTYSAAGGWVTARDNALRYFIGVGIAF